MRGSLVLVLVLTLAPACDRKGPSSRPSPPPDAPAAEAALSGPAEDITVLGPASPVEVEPRGASADPAGRASERRGATEEQCRAACATVLRLTRSDFPPEATVEARAAIEETLRADCPTQCLRRGTPQSVECTRAARSLAALAACPR